MFALLAVGGATWRFMLSSGKKDIMSRYAGNVAPPESSWRSVSEESFTVVDIDITITNEIIVCPVKHVGDKNSIG